MWPPTDPQKYWTHTHQVVFAFYIYFSKWISNKWPNGHNGALTWNGNTGVGPVWTNGTNLASQMEWPYLPDGHFSLNDIFNCLFYAGLHSNIIAVSNMFNKVRIFWFSGPTIHLKLEGLSWFRSLGLLIFAQLEAYPLKSLEYQLNVLITYSSWLPHRVET